LKKKQTFRQSFPEAAGNAVEHITMKKGYRAVDYSLFYLPAVRISNVAARQLHSSSPHFHRPFVSGIRVAPPARLNIPFIRGGVNFTKVNSTFTYTDVLTYSSSTTKPKLSSRREYSKRGTVMKKTLSFVLSIFLSAAICGCSNSGSGSTTHSATLSPVRTTWPIVREASGQWEIVGEAVFTNTGTEKLVLQSVNLKVFESSGNTLSDRTYSGGNFNDMIVIYNSTSTSELAPGNHGFGHVAALAGDSSLPTLARVTISFTNGKSETTDIALYEFDPGQQTIWPLTMGGGDWLVFDTSETNYHWKAVSYNPAINDYVIDQRYAIDVMQFDSNYNLSDPLGNPSSKESYYAWGEDILSAGSGTVVTVVWDQIDQELSKIWTPAEVTETNIMGNYVVIEHGPALFSLYVHMMQNSATVSVGDHVATGQVIGKIGNSGFTVSTFGVADGIPHLHFQYMDAKDRSKAQGLPALFSNAKVIRYSDVDILSAFGYLPDIRLQNYLLTAGTYTLNGGTLLEFDTVTAL